MTVLEEASGRIVGKASASDKIRLDGGGSSVENDEFLTPAPAPQQPQSSWLPMADDSFDVASLAAYLHMMPAQVTRLAERGQLPGRRIGGQWRFSRPEVSHWLEERMGLSDDDELAAMESRLRRDDSHGASEIDLGELLPLETIAVPLAARTRASVIKAMCELAAASGRVWDVDKLADAVSQRESMAPTAMENGLALLHPRRPQSSILGEAVIALGITTGGIPFGGGPAGSGLTDVFILIAATSDHEYLRTLARVSRIVNDREWVAELRACPDAAAARQLVLERDATISA